MNVDIKNEAIKPSLCRVYDLFVIVIGRKRNADFSATNGSTISVRIVSKILKSFISGLCSHSSAVDFFVHSIRNPNAFPAQFCLTLNGALNQNCAGTSRAHMGNSLRFE